MGKGDHKFGLEMVPYHEIEFRIQIDLRIHYFLHTGPILPTGLYFGTTFKKFRIPRSKLVTFETSRT